MIHGINNTYLYAAKKIIAVCSDGTYVKSFRGTGFFIEKDSEYFFVTNRHMIEPAYDDPDYTGYSLIEFHVESYESFDFDGLPTTLKSAAVVNFNEFVFDKNEFNDVACLKNPKVVGGMTINAPIAYSMLATHEWISDNLSVCDTIAYPGFPAWYDRQNNTPIFRMGTIASDPRLDYSCFPGAPISSQIAYEGFSTGGASGSPVFAIQRGFQTGAGISAPKDFYREVKLIGINAGHFKDQKGHSGISYLYKSSVIHDIINTI